MKYLDLTGLQKFWAKVKNHVQTSLQGYAKTTDIPKDYTILTLSADSGTLTSGQLAELKANPHKIVFNRSGYYYFAENLSSSSVWYYSCNVFYSGSSIIKRVITITMASGAYTKSDYTYAPPSVDTSKFVTKDESGGVLIQTKQGNNTIEVYEDEQESYISIGSNALGLHGVAYISTHDGSYGENGQVLMIKDGLVTWGNPSGGTSSGDPSIIDLGEQPAHKDAQVNMINYLADAENGCYLFKYWCSCYGNACLAVVYKSDFVISGIVYDNYRSFREFLYDTNEGRFTVDGCWEDIGTSSGGAGLSMPRIRLANHWMASDEITYNKDYDEWLGEYIFSVEIMDGTLQEGDQLQICSLTNHKNSRGVRVRKPRRFSERVITAEDIEMLSYNPYLQISVTEKSLKDLYRSCSSDGTLYRYPKYIRIRRPKYDENGQEIGATFSNVVCADVRLLVTIYMN